MKTQLQLSNNNNNTNNTRFGGAGLMRWVRVSGTVGVDVCSGVL